MLQHDDPGRQSDSQEAALDPEAYATAVLAVRREKDEFFASSPDSPIPAQERTSSYRGLRYYPPDPTYRVEAVVEPFANPDTVLLGSTTGALRPQVRYATLRFTLEGEPHQLVAFTDPDMDPDELGELFIPFRDATTGTETYGAGRYLEAEEQRDGAGRRFAILDFNLAYSPWCAYNEAYTCILPPRENVLSASVRAGERTYHDDQG